MAAEKLNKLMQEFYQMKAEITSGEVSLKRNYLLFKKYMLMIKLYDEYKKDLEQEMKAYKKQEIVLAVAACCIFLPMALINPFVLLVLIYIIKRIKDKGAEYKKEADSHTLQEYGIINNAGEIIYNKLMREIANLTEEQMPAFEQEVHKENAVEVLTPAIYDMLKESYDVSQTSIGDVENYVIYEAQVRKRKNKKTNPQG